MRKLFAVLVSMLVMTCASLCFAAETYQMVYEANNFTEALENDQAVTETFTTPYGTLKVQMRKLWQSSSEKRMHLISWMDGTRIADEYFPKVEYGYTFRVVKNISNSELYYIVQSIDRAYLYGYSADKKTVMTYIDSNNYAHEPGTYPYIVALKDGSLVLSFEHPSRTNPVVARYQFNWDNSKKWFGYRDIGSNWASVITNKQ